MVAQIKALKTNRAYEKEQMLAYIDFLRVQVVEEHINNLIFIVDEGDTVTSEVIGDMTAIQAVGMFDTAKLAYQLSILDDSE